MALQGLFTPLSSDRICNSSLPLLRSSTASWQRRRKPFLVVAGADKRDNLDHLQRTTTGGHRPQQVQFNKRQPQPATSVVWDRFPTARTVQQMMDTMERLMDDPLAFSNTSWPSRSERMQDGYGRGRTPWAIREREGDYKMRFDMPGMTREDVKVWVEDNMLVVKAEKGVKEGEKKQQEANVNGTAGAAGDEDEWPAKSYGKYGFRLAVPENIEFEKIKAEVKDGVLTITVPKASSNTKVVDINVQ